MFRVLYTQPAWRRGAIRAPHSAFEGSLMDCVRFLRGSFPDDIPAHIIRQVGYSIERVTEEEETAA